MTFKIGDVVLFNYKLMGIHILGIIDHVFDPNDPFASPYQVKPFNNSANFSFTLCDDSDLVSLDDLTEIEKEFYGINNQLKKRCF